MCIYPLLASGYIHDTTLQRAHTPPWALGSRSSVWRRDAPKAASAAVLPFLRKEARSSVDDRASRKTAATYSPNWWVSTIGDGELNFSVRNGKRWFLTAIATAIYVLREKPTRTFKAFRPSVTRMFRFLGHCTTLFLQAYLSIGKVNRDISTGRLRMSPSLHLLPIDVVVSNVPHGKSHLGDGFALRCFQRLS